MTPNKVWAKKATLTYNKKITISVFKVNLRDPSIGSNLILNGLLKVSSQERQSFTIVYFNNMYLANLINNGQCFLLQLEMQKYRWCGIYIIWSQFCVSTKRQKKLLLYQPGFWIYLRSGSCCCRIYFKINLIVVILSRTWIHK